ncbi:MAG: oligosaccharide flippase family protein [Lentisphaerae bacterium]|jgi:O-antigen/teichoic acid export membrane protein|nr:oligosaccharide flippase family protein [Lentisphaerota bacterium]
MTATADQTTGALEDAVQQDQEQDPGFSLKRAFLRGSAWSFSGYVLQQILRLAGNLILTRLLFPEAFGLMALVNIFLQGLAMFSDLGLGPSIIQNPRGTEPDFLNTAWTIQVIRGFILCGCALLMSWPLSLFYHQSELAFLLPVAGISAVISGFESTAMYTENRKLVLGRITLIGIVAQFAGLVVMAAWAWHEKTVWALLAGSLVATTVRMLLSHCVLPGIRNRFHWDPKAWRALLTFGKWIFVSTALGFLASQGDRLILGRCLTISDLGVYNIALFLAQAIVSALTTVSMTTLFPLYSRLAQDDPDAYATRVWKFRLVFMAVAFPILAVLIVFGDFAVHVLYDERWQAAGWMLQVLSVGSVAAILNLTLSALLLAVGDSFRFMLFQLWRSVCLVIAMSVGGFYFGTKGLIVGVAAAPWLAHPFLVACVRRYRVWTPFMDLACLAGAAALVGMGFLIKPPIVDVGSAVFEWLKQAVLQLIQSC